MSKEINYGKYLPIPKLINGLFEMEENLGIKGYSLEAIDLRLEKEDYRYSITPPDLITFASTGGDGIHFGFLTDFGTTANLEDAFIVCVSPSNDPPIKIVARNLKEFLDLVITVKFAEQIDNMRFYETEDEFNQNIDELLNDDEERKEEIEYIITKLKEEFACQEITNIYGYIDDIKKERQDLLAIETLDEIGIIKGTLGTKPSEVFAFTEDNSQNINLMKEFLNNASQEQKLAFFRDAIYSLLLDEETSDINNLIIEEMIKLGLEDEAARFRSAVFPEAEVC